ncbi:MAG: hypothetical protein ACOC0T_05895, partial [Desulfovermiculus sp.]
VGAGRGLQPEYQGFFGDALIFEPLGAKKHFRFAGGKARMKQDFTPKVALAFPGVGLVLSETQPL